MSTYRGERIEDVPLVYKDGRLLRPGKSQRVRNHSPTGFDWGYLGSGPAQLALALLLEEVPSETAQDFYQSFKGQVVAGWQGSWKITGTEICDWMHKERCQRLILSDQ